LGGGKTGGKKLETAPGGTWFGGGKGRAQTSIWCSTSNKSLVIRENIRKGLNTSGVAGFEKTSIGVGKLVLQMTKRHWGKLDQPNKDNGGGVGFVSLRKSFKFQAKPGCVI